MLLQSITNILTNREIAIIIWAIIIVNIVIFTKRSILNSVWRIIEVLFTNKISLVFLSILIYTLMMSALLFKLRLWNILMIKDTIYWYVGVGIRLLSDIINPSGGYIRFNSKVVSVLRIAIIIEFIVNFYVFPLWAEVVFIPIILIISLLSVPYKKDKATITVNILMNRVINFISYMLIAYIVIKIINDPNTLFSTDNLKAMALPFALTIMYIPLLYLITILLKYKTLFVRLDLYINNRKLCKIIKMEIIKVGNIRLSRINKIANSAIPGVKGLRKNQDILKFLRKITNDAN